MIHRSMLLKNSKSFACIYAHKHSQRENSHSRASISERLCVHKYGRSCTKLYVCIHQHSEGIVVWHSSRDSDFPLLGISISTSCALSLFSLCDHHSAPEGIYWLERPGLAFSFVKIKWRNQDFQDSVPLVNAKVSIKNTSITQLTREYTVHTCMQVYVYAAKPNSD